MARCSASRLGAHRSTLTNESGAATKSICRTREYFPEKGSGAAHLDNAPELASSLDQRRMRVLIADHMQLPNTRFYQRHRRPRPLREVGMEHGLKVQDEGKLGEVGAFDFVD